MRETKCQFSIFNFPISWGQRLSYLSGLCRSGAAKFNVTVESILAACNIENM